MFDFGRPGPQQDSHPAKIALGDEGGKGLIHSDQRSSILGPVIPDQDICYPIDTKNSDKHGGVGLHPRPSRKGQIALPVSMEDGVPRLFDFTPYEKMVGEYRVMGIYPRGHLMEFVRPSLGPNVLPAAEVDRLQDGEMVRVAGWPVARQHPRGRDGTVFITIEDETGDVQVIVRHDLFARRGRELGSQMVEVTGRVSRWDGTTNVTAMDPRAVPSGVSMPPSHDWH